MPVVETEAVFALLAKSRLLTDSQLAELRAEIDSAAGSLSRQLLLARLVERQSVTRWQARMLLSGQTGFFLLRYKLLNELGSGGMGTVYQAEHAGLKRIVALKVMAPQLLRDERAIARFHREIQAAAALDHPNIVAAFDAESIGETHFLVMEYVAGQTLADLVKGDKSLPIATACEYIRQAALGLAHAHERGMAHRDIKPANLLLTSAVDRSPLVKILDMGLARFASESKEDDGLTRTGQIMGTPDFIAPEQAQNTKAADIRSDIFSLGCTLFRLLTGRLPFGGQNVMEKLMARALHDAPRVRSLRPEIPEGLDAVVAKMLAREPGARHQAPQEVAAALEPWAASVRRGASKPVAGTIAAPESGTNSADVDATQEFLPADVDPQLDSFLRLLATAAVDDAEFGINTGQWSRPAHELPTVAMPSPAAETPSARSPRPSRRRPADRRKMLIGLGLGAGVLALVIGLAIWHRQQQATLVVDWPEEDRADATLEIDGIVRPAAARGALEFIGRAGKRAVKLERAGYEPFELEFKLAAGQTRVVRPEWKPTAASRRAAALQALRHETTELLQGMTLVPETLDPRIVLLNQRLAEFAQNWHGTPEENEAQRLRGRLPVPLDTLRREQIAPADLRAAGFGNPARAPAALVAVYGNRRFKHWNTIRSVIVSPNGKTIYTAGDDGVIREWDRETGEELRVIDGNLLGIHHLNCTADGRSLVYAGVDSTENHAIHIMSLAGDREPIAMTGHRSVINAVAYNSQVNRIASAGRDGTIRIWNAETGAAIRTLESHESEVTDVALSPNGEWGASAGHDGFVRVWNSDTGDERLALPYSDSFAFCVTISPDGKLLAAGGGARQGGYLLKVWNAETGELQYERDPAPFSLLRFSPDGRFLVGGRADLSVMALDPLTGNDVQRFAMETVFLDLTFVDGGRTLIVGGIDGSLQLWNMETAARIAFGPPGEHTRAVVAAGMSSDGTRLVSVGSEGTVVVRDSVTGEIASSFDESFQELRGINVAAISTDGRRAVTGGINAVRARDVQTGELNYLQPAVEASGIERVAFARNGETLAIAAEKPSRMRIINLQTRDDSASFPLADASVESLAITSDGLTAVTGMSDGATHVWSVPSGRKVTTLRTAGTPLVALSPDGQTAATLGQGYLLQFWNTPTWKEIGQLENEPALAAVSSMAFDPAGHRLACSSGAGAVSIFDVETRSLVDQIPIGPAGIIVWNVAFSPDGRHLVTANANGTVYVLRLKPWSP